LVRELVELEVASPLDSARVPLVGPADVDQLGPGLKELGRALGLDLARGGRLVGHAMSLFSAFPIRPKGDSPMPEAVIVDAVRTPIGRAFKGSLAQQRPDEMG